MKQIILLASYPKSGNTWLRAFFSNLMNNSGRPVDINNMSIPWGISRPKLDQLLGIMSADLTTAEIWSYLPAVYKRLAASSSPSPLFIKTHSMNWTNSNGESLFPADALKGVIYLVRNPLDVCVSFARHSGWNIDHTISVMANPDYNFFGSGNQLHSVVKEKVSSWSINVSSWLDRLDVPIHVVRYEDMLTNPVGLFSEIVRFCDLSSPGESIRDAIESSKFSQLQKQEKANGFYEKNPKGGYFFRQGKAGCGRMDLTVPQIELLIRDHALIMNRFGYEGI